MRIMTNKAVLVTTATATLAVAAAVAAPRTAGATAARWEKCTGTGLDPHQECATIQVPLSYHDPGGRQITLAISRIRSARPESRRGALLLIPGGPGGSSLNEPSTLRAKMPATVRGAYDVIGFDPRGVGQSTPVSCDLAHDDLLAVNQRPWPAPDGGIAGNVTTARRIARTCLRNGGPVLRSISTKNEARDIDRVRAALGERRLSAWGVSYGTYAGAAYATMFPQRTDRVVLDSNDDPDPTRVARGWLANYAVGVEDRFPDFAQWAAQPGNPYRLATTPGAVRPLFLSLAAKLDRAPMPWPGADPPQLTGNVLRETLVESMYAGDRFPDLAALMLAARGDRPLPAPGTAPPDAALQNVTAVAVSTICDDVSWPRSIPAIAKDVAADRAGNPLTAGMPRGVMPCVFWPAPDEPSVRVTPHGPANVLLAQNLRDPATPYSGALKLRGAFGRRARMVTVDSGGHEVYLANGNTCGDRLVTGFLVNGRRPARDAFCPAED
ncbi:MAG: alpha/beta hydrolase [Actinoallomurus sp.]